MTLSTWLTLTTPVGAAETVAGAGALPSEGAGGGGGSGGEMTCVSSSSAASAVRGARAIVRVSAAARGAVVRRKD